MKKELWENSEVTTTKVTWYKGLKVIHLTLKDKSMYFEYRRKIQATRFIIRKVKLDTIKDTIEIIYMSATNGNYLDRIAYFKDHVKLSLMQAVKYNLVE